jgi:hypothetical protein
MNHLHVYPRLPDFSAEQLENHSPKQVSRNTCGSRI